MDDHRNHNDWRIDRVLPKFQNDWMTIGITTTKGSDDHRNCNDRRIIRVLPIFQNDRMVIGIVMTGGSSESYPILVKRSDDHRNYMQVSPEGVGNYQKGSTWVLSNNDQSIVRVLTDFYKMIG